MEFVFTQGFLRSDFFVINRKRQKKINPICQKQNYLRNQLKTNFPKEIIEIEDNIFGIDYQFRNITFDQKFSFGKLGENAIKIRTKKRKLVNKSDWTLIINKNEKIELFETKKLSKFVKQNWDLIQKRTIEKKKYYNSHIIYLDEFYKQENIIPININFTNIKITLEELSEKIIDCSKKICLLNIVA
jgi:hypothetical protein